LGFPFFPPASRPTPLPAPLVTTTLLRPALLFRLGFVGDPPFTRRQPDGKKLDCIGREVFEDFFHEVRGPLLGLCLNVEVGKHRKVHRGGRGVRPQPAAGIVLVEQHPGVADGLQKRGRGAVCPFRGGLTNFKNSKGMKVWHKAYSVFTI
jgi:hypothetical protein